MTEKLYYSDSHLHRFSATVTQCRQRNGSFVIVLDRSAFFPGGGGQSADTGYIGSAQVTAMEEADGELLHICSSPLPVGQEQSCSLDYEKRLRRMQNHSGEHIVSGLIHSLFGYENTGFHMGEDCMTIDFGGELSHEQLRQVETRANQAVRANLPVTAVFPDSETLAALNYRSKLALTENVRIVEIEGIDRCACCAPHVKRTGEIGMIKLLDFQRHRGGVRIELVCGMDALDNYRLWQDNNTAISQALSVKRNDTAVAVNRVLSQQQRQKERCDALSMELVRLKAAAAEYTPGNICVFEELLDESALRELINLLTAKCGGLAAGFTGSDGEGWRYVIGSSSLDLKALSRELNSHISGKGGGSIRMIQGSAQADRKTIEEYLKY